jgi:hypothetical protein
VTLIASREKNKVSGYNNNEKQEFKAINSKHLIT